MTSLIRTKQGNISLDNTNTLEELETNNYKYYKIEEVLYYPKIEVDDDLYRRISHGMKILNSWDVSNRVIFTYKNKLLGIYEVEDNYLKVWKNFN